MIASRTRSEHGICLVEQQRRPVLIDGAKERCDADVHRRQRGCDQRLQHLEQPRLATLLLG